MRSEYFKNCMLTGCLLLVTFPANAQEVVHAICGTVRSIDSTNKTITIVTGDGTRALFDEMKKSEVRLDFDKRVRVEATAQESPPKTGDQAIVYYFGRGDRQTAVAVQDLGTGPFKEVSGNVVKFDRRERLLTVKSSLGVEESFHLDPKTVADTPFGVIEGLELDAKDGEEVQVISSSTNGNEMAWFILAT